MHPALTRSLSVFRSEVQTRIACKIPGVSYLIHCPGDGVTTTDPMMMHIPNFADLVNKQAASYELIADTLSSLNPAFVPKARSAKKAGGGSSSSSSSDDPEDPYGLSMHNQKGGLPLPLLLKRAELAVVDLKVLVKHSTLPEVGKALLVEKLQMFHTRAKTTSRQLQFLQARANGCVDGLVIRNVYLTLELDRLEEQQLRLRDGRRTGPGGAVAGIWDKMLDFFAAPRDLQIATSEQKLQQLYHATMEDAQNHVRDLIHQSQEVLQSLDTLDQVLLAIHEIATQERRQQNQAHGETLALLWSRLGGNRLQRGVYRDNLELLKEMDGQRKATVGQIQTALWKLTDFEAEIGFLREKIVDASMDVAADGGPQVVGGPSEEGGPKTMPGKMSAASGMGASLRAHIQQIDLVTSRLKSRSFLADAMMSEQQLEQEGGEERVPGLADMPLHGSQEPPMT
ncbi:hypothetical protein BGZ99_000289 [Dissophora globulifera]|uniref:Uncharacterized protein n=1 Tax=Dissophora globulifera TaxID=979702 RepID=A0A9P6RPY3_9FUNG|nr:hypothetical protein BGZ99_000289 [Dissophora globulifera]